MKEKLMPLRIQMFGSDNEEGENAVTQTDNNTEGTGTEPVKKTEKNNFTQEEVNAMILKEVNKVTKKYEGVDLKKYKEWEDQNKTNEEKYADIVKENEKLKNDLVYAENKSVVANAGVDSKFQKFVLSEVSGLDGDFEENLTNYLKDNPQYLINEENSSKPKSTGISQNGANPQVSEKQAYLDKKYAKNPYYKK